MYTYTKANKYSDLYTIYAQCGGPGGLKLAEFMTEKMQLQAGKRLLDVGTSRGYQSCFLAKEYGVFVVGIDPWPDRDGTSAHIDHLMKNAQVWGVPELMLGVQVGVPDTRFAENTFDYVYSTTTLEMIRGIEGEEAYRRRLAEIYRVLKPGGVFGLGEPMHLDAEIPADLAPLVTQGNESWADCFATIQETETACQSVGLETTEADYAPDARLWWEEYTEYDEGCQEDPDGERRAIEVDAGRWISFGYVVAKKPSTSHDETGR
jgi:cyclopropane fatty-acyl-phospholipid synthase-like methyltransferase